MTASAPPSTSARSDHRHPVNPRPVEPMTVAGSPAKTDRTQARVVALIVIGVIGGALSGLFAIGGAIVMVPLLTWRAGFDQRTAAATSLVAIIPTAVVSSAIYWSHISIDVAAAALVAAGSIGGAVVGSRLLKRLPLTVLRWAFIAFILGVAAQLLVSPAQPNLHSPAWSPTLVFGYLLLGALTGVAAGLFGIGGAIISVPALIAVFATADLAAKGIALIASVPTSLAGTISNARGGIPVDLRAGLTIGAAATGASVPAAHLAATLSPMQSAVSFSALLVGIAVWLTVKALRAQAT